MSSAGRKVSKEFKRIDDNFKKATGGMDRFVANALTLGAAEPLYFQPRNAQREINEQAKFGQRQAMQQANAQRRQADRDFNRANPKVADILQLLMSRRQRGATGGASTFLTGSQGLDKGSLQLGGSSLLGS